MRPLPLVHLPGKVTAIVPVITASVVRAVHGQPPLMMARLDRAIVHAKLLLDELQSAKTVLGKIERKRNERKDDVA